MTDKELITQALGLDESGRPTRRHIYLPEEGAVRDQCDRMCKAGLLYRIGNVHRSREDHLLYVKMCDQKLAREAGRPWKTTEDLDRFARSFLSEPVGNIRYHVTPDGAHSIGVYLPGGLFPAELAEMRSRQKLLA